MICWKTWPPWDETSFSYVNIGITIKIFLSKSTWSIENNSTLMVIEWPSTKIVHIFIGWKTWLQRNIIKLSNSLDPDQAKYFGGPILGPNCLQMLSVEKTLARIKRSCQKFLGYLKKNQHIWSFVLLYHDCSNYVNLSKMATMFICVSSHLFVCESVTATVIDQIWFNLGLYDKIKVLHSVTLANIKAGFG